MYCQVWWPTLEIGPLHLTHPSAHTQQWVVNTHTHTLWTHTQSSGQPLLQRPGISWGFGALLKGTSVMVLKVERVLFIHNPHLQFLPVRESNQRPSGYKPNSLTARPQLPPYVLIMCTLCAHHERGLLFKCLNQSINVQALCYWLINIKWP